MTPPEGYKVIGKNDDGKGLAVVVRIGGEGKIRERPALSKKAAEEVLKEHATTHKIVSLGDVPFVEGGPVPQTR